MFLLGDLVAAGRTTKALCRTAFLLRSPFAAAYCTRIAALQALFAAAPHMQEIKLTLM